MSPHGRLLVLLLLRTQVMGMIPGLPAGLLQGNAGDDHTKRLKKFM